MKKLFLVIIIPFLSFGQGWEQTFGGANDEVGWDVQNTDDGGYIVVGSIGSYSNYENDIYLIKTDQNGQELWSQTFGGAGDEVGRSIQKTDDGGYIIVGSSSSYGNGENDVYLIKTDQDGQELWSQTFGGVGDDIGRFIQNTDDGGYIIVGRTSSYGNGENDVYLIKTDQDGQELWSQTFGGAGGEVARSIQKTNDGGYVISGSTNSYGNGGYDVYLIKTDQDGQELWSQTFGGSANDIGRSIQETDDGGYVISGNTNSYGNGGHDVYLIKTDQDGQELWSQTFGGAAGDVGRSIQKTDDGGYLIAGNTYSYGIGESNVYLLQTDQDGQELWSQTFGDTGYHYGWSIQKTNDGAYVIVGYTYYVEGDYDIYLIKTDGKTSSIEGVCIPNSNIKLKTTIGILGRETNNNKGFQLHIYDDGSVEKKYLVK